MTSQLNPLRVVWFEVLGNIIMVEFLALFYPLFGHYSQFLISCIGNLRKTCTGIST